MLNRLAGLRCLTLDGDTRIPFPLSLFTDTEHVAPVEELHLPRYRLNEVLSNDSLANLHDGRHVDTTLKVELLQKKGGKTDRFRRF